VAILLRPTKSLGLFLQQVGRSLRPSPGKDHAIILDHANNCREHGLPDDERMWSLQGREKKDRKAPSSVRICPKCFAASRRGSSSCSQCQHIFAVESREVEQRDGDLSEVNVEAYRATQKHEQGSARTLESLIALGKKRGYKNPFWWAQNVIKHRTEKMVR
jgi:superfamily II DNA or RNA helicase